MILVKSEQERQRERQQARHEQLDRLPASIRKWVQELEKSGRQQIDELDKQTARRLQPLEEQAGKLQGRINGMQAELKTARAWLAAIPAEAEPSDVTRQMTIQTTWPTRIDAAQSQLDMVRAQIASINRDRSYQMDKIAAEIRLTYLDAGKQLEALMPDIFS